MLITVRVPDDQAAFFKKVVKTMSFDVMKSQKDSLPNSVPTQKTATPEPQAVSELKSAFKTLDSIKEGTAVLYTEDEFFKLLKEA